MKKAVVLHSGGLDSTVCLLLAVESGAEVTSVGINYNQRHAIELHYANAQCRKRAIDRIVLQVAWSKPERVIPERRTLDEMRSSVSPAFLPGRNAIFLSLALAEAAARGASEVWIGVNAVDFSGYPDCRPEFIDAFQQMAEKAIPDGPIVIAPLLNWTKAQIAEEAIRLGLVKGDTWSCYTPAISEAGLLPCGMCDACILHEHAWAEALNKSTPA
jgi:7-cyano-7-deazaguanine synthase